MKLYRNAIILIIIVALLGGVYFFVLKDKPADDEQGDDDDAIVLTDVLAEDVDTITIKNSGDTFVLTVKEEKWVLSSPEDIISDPSVIDGIAAYACSVSAEMLVEENAQDLSLYGLDSPVIIALKLKDGTVISLEVGNETPVKKGYYARISGENNVYTIGSYGGRKLLTDRNGMKKKELFELTSDAINKLSMDRGGQNVFEAVLSEDQNWEMVKPISGNANPTALYPMTEALAVAEALEFIEENPSDLSQYGLDAPRYVFEFSSEESGAYKLLLGKEKTRDRDIYAMMDGRDEVFTLSTENFIFLDKPVDEIFQVFAYIINIDEVKAIDFTMDGKTTHMKLDVYKDEEGNSDKSKDKFTVNGIDASGENEDGKQPFRMFYQALIGVSLDEIDLDGVPDGDPEITIKYTLQSSDTMQVDFISMDEHYYYVLRNGEYANILVKKNKGEFGVRGVREAYNDMMDFLAQ